MKFLKSNLAKKLIIILIALMIFNIAIPQQVKAWDVAGILLKPMTSILVAILINIDITIGLWLTGISAAVDVLGDIVERVTADEGEELRTYEHLDSALKKIFIGPDTIFSGEVLMLNANIFKDITEVHNSDVVAYVSSTLQPGYPIVVKVRESIANIYYTLRNICAYIMLAGLIFTGIRILTSANRPTKRGMYLNLLEDWLLGMILLIFSHIIMIGIFEVSDLLTDALSRSTVGIGSLNLTLAGQALASYDSAEQIVVVIMLGYLIWLTVIFAIAYFKRFLWVCVLIVFAPVVSVMYAFGQQTKQIYTKWLREYMMAVFVQPFHMIIYWVLVSIPLEVVNSSGEFSFGTLGSFEIIYALLAISFIRPAEAYMRQLFGMNQGIANMASYDSGKQTFDEIKRTVTETVKKVGLAVAVVATGGAAAAAGGAVTAAGGAAASGAGGALAGGAAASGAGGALAGGASSSGGALAAGEGTAALTAGGEGMGGATIFGSNPDLLNADMSHQDIYGDISRDPFHDDYFAGDEFYDNDLQTPRVQENKSDKMTESELNDFLYSMGLEEEERKDYERYLREEGHGTQEPEKESSTSKVETKPETEAKIEEGTSNEDGNKIHASSVTIVGDNIELKEINANNEKGNSESVERIGINKQEEEQQENINNEGDTQQNIKNKLRDEEIEIEEGEGQEEGKGKRKNLYMRTTDYGKTANEILEGKQNVFSVAKNFLGKADEFRHSTVGRLISPLSVPLGDAIEKTKLGQKAKEKVDKGLEIGEKFDDLGGTTDLYKGLNRVRDTFFVAPAQYKDWEHTVSAREQGKKERDEKTEFNFVHDEGHKEYIIQQKKLMEKYSEENYPKKSEAERRDMAEKEAESTLSSLAKSYIPLGITNVETAYKLSQDQKEYGFTPREAILNEGDYQRFNAEPANITVINEKFDEKVSYVSEAVPAARECYNNGYRDVQGMLNVQFIQDRLQTSLDMAMKVEKALSQKGKVNYNGKDEQVKKKFDEINQYYANNMKKKGEQK